MFPYFLKTPWFTIYAYGTMLALGYGLATVLTVRRASSAGWDLDWLQDLIIKMLVFGVIGARLFHVVFEWSRYSGNLAGIFRLQDGGLSILGGVMGGAFIVFRTTRAAGVPIWRFADLITPGFALALCFGRLGCFLNGCCYGIETTLPWGICFPTAGLDIARHPTQLYLSAAHFTFFLLTFRKWRFPEGGLFCRFVAWYSISRLTIEAIRVHKSAYYFMGVSVFQMILACMALVSVGLILRERSREQGSATQTNAAPAGGAPLPDVSRGTEANGPGALAYLAPFFAISAIAGVSLVMAPAPSFGADFDPWSKFTGSPDTMPSSRDVGASAAASGSALPTVEPVKPKSVKVMVLPFANRSETDGAISKIWDETSAYLNRNGFDVIGRDRVREIMDRRRIFPNTVLTDAEVRALAGEEKADLAVRGIIDDFGSSRKFRPAAVLGVGAILYGTVKVSARVISVSDGRIVWDKTFAHTKKRQVLGILQAHRLVMAEAVERVVRGLFQPFCASFQGR